MNTINFIQIDTTPFVTAFGIMVAIAATVLSCIFLLPEAKREGLPKLFKLVADIFNFKELYLEKILRILYIFSTVACVAVGILMIFGFTIYGDFVTWYGGYGLLLAICGPIVLRLVFEIIMMFILLVKNVLDINKKMK